MSTVSDLFREFKFTAPVRRRPSAEDAEECSEAYRSPTVSELVASGRLTRVPGGPCYICLAPATARRCDVPVCDEHRQPERSDHHGH